MTESHDIGGAEDLALLGAVRSLERRRIEAIRHNDVAQMSEILDDKFIYIDSDGNLYDKPKYLRVVGSHELTYSIDVELTETDHRIDRDVIIIAGQMLGHARLGGEPQVFHLRNMRVWRQREAHWRLLAWQSSTIMRAPTWSGQRPPAGWTF